MYRFTSPKEYLENPVIGSRPTVERSRPIRPAMIPLSMFFPEILAMTVRPNRASVQYSGALNFSASLASCGASRIRMIALTVPPSQEETVEIPIARPPSPLSANLHPSSIVAADAGVPGVWINMAVIDPPYIAPKDMARSMAIPAPASIPYVNGRSRVTPITEVSPGMAPIMIPPAEPASIIRKTFGWNM